MKNYNKDMRRANQMLDIDLAHEIIASAQWGVLSMVEQRNGKNSGYGVPINFVWDGEQSIYMHCAMEGHKLDCLDSCAEVSFCITAQTKLIEEEFTTDFQSIIIRGRITRHLDADQRIKALEMFVNKYSSMHKDAGDKLIERLVHRTEILRLEIESTSGKNKVG